MAVPVFISNQQFGLFAASVAQADLTTGSKLYIYVNAIGEAEMADMIGKIGVDGTLYDGKLVDLIQSLATKDLDSSSCVLAQDVDPASPYRGRLRLEINVL